MIRMGRGSNDQPGSDNEHSTSDTGYRYQSETSTPAAGRAIAESDAMARDIKEGRLSGYVGHGTTLTGETEFQAMLRVDGRLVGSVSSETGTLLVGTQGQVDANIMVVSAVINGSVTGDILASERLQLGRTARVVGNIQAPKLIVEEGAIIEGGCSMLSARESLEKTSGTQTTAYGTQEPSVYHTDPPAIDDGDDDTEALFTDDEEEDATADAAAV